MSKQIIKQPDGNFAVWSSGLDDFIVLDATPRDLMRYFGREAYNKAEAEVLEIINELNDGSQPYYQFTMTWEEAQQLRRAG